jgi:ribulose-5-phosphate 4-epimerase/fuculose-1-phosphate aldolase
MATKLSAGDAQQAAALREEVALANRLLHHYGLGAYEGHVSARVPNTDLVLIRARPAVSLDRVQPADLMLIDLDGNAVEASADYPERVTSWALHTEIYKARPEVASVTHTHQKWCTVFGIAGRDVLPVIHPPTASVAAETWPVYAEAGGTVTTPEQGRRVAEVLGGNVACHLRNHGMVFVGTTVSKAMLAAADAEEQAEVTWRAMLAGTPEPIDMKYLANEVKKRWEPPKEDVRDGVARGEWGNQKWLDDHREASEERGITL